MDDLPTCNLQRAAAILHAHEGTVAALAKSGEIPGRKIGRAWVFVVADLIAFVRQGNPPRARKAQKEPPLSREEMDQILERVKRSVNATPAPARRRR